MKKLILFISLLIAAGLTAINAQDTWTQKADLGIWSYARSYAVGFSIGSKGYIGTGYLAWDSPEFYSDFWEYDAATDVWTQKAKFPGGLRSNAVGFSIGSKGYMGTGYYGDYTTGYYAYFTDFWEYDTANNTWTQKSDFGGTERSGAVGFSIGGKGYIGTGYSYDGSTHYYKDFWEYDPATDEWTRKADFEGSARMGAVGFSIDNKGYIGTGTDYFYTYNDFWEYNPVTDAWAQKSDFEGTASNKRAVGFSIGNKGYIGTGSNTSDFWEYDPAADKWNQKSDFGGTGRFGAVGFSIGSKGYIGTGEYWVTGIHDWYNDFWEYAPEEETNCTIPGTLSSTKITSASARLNWNVVDGAVGYMVRYRVVGSDVVTMKSTTSNFKKLSGLSPGTSYMWQVKTFCSTVPPALSSGWSTQQFFTTNSLKLEDELSTSFDVYPNPFESSTTISFSVAEDSRVQISLYDVAGKLMQTVLNKNVSAGDHTITLDRNQLIAGIYLLKLQVNDQMIVRKVVIE